MTATPQFGPGAPYCAPPQSEVRAPRHTLPNGACDTHAHICGPQSRFAYAASRIYTPPDALVPDYVQLLRTLGCSRAVVVQPSVYGADNTVTVGALDDLRGAGIEARAVAVVDAGVSDAELDRLNRAGVRGLRFNLVDVVDPGVSAPLDAMRRLAARTAHLGWHTELLVHVDNFPNLDAMFADWPVDVVLGHMGYCHPGKSPDDPGFRALLRLMERGRCWVKLSGPYRIAPGNLPYPEASAFARALRGVAPERLVWGTDWPHVMVTKAMPNDGDLCDLLEEWIPDAGERHRIAVDNAVALYGFDRTD